MRHARLPSGPRGGQTAAAQGDGARHGQAHPRALAQRQAIERAFGQAGQPAQRFVISGGFEKKLKAWAKGAGSDEVKRMLEWFKAADELTQDDVQRYINKTTFDAWSFAWDGVSSVGVSATQLSKGPAQQKIKAPVDELAEVRKQLTLANLNPAKFVEDELRNILDLKKTEGWDKAISTINQVRLARETASRLREERQAKYSEAHLKGLAVFTDALARDVWNCAYSVAVSGTAGPNNTLGGGLRADGAIATAVAQWRGRPAGIAVDQQGSEAVTNVHVPGGIHFIEDKSRRAVNRDPSRNRQCDFISTWGNVEINIHVDADPPHLA